MKPQVQASKVDFQLHTLGWEAFQDLTNHIIREVLGQTAAQFSHSRDAGQDGAFRGTWKKQNNELIEGPFIVQCKFTNKRNEHLQLADVEDEVEKARRLVDAEAVNSYIIVTNAGLSGDSDLKIRKAFRDLGVQHVEIYGEEWITGSILTNRKLRAHVPRIYGLGDISQILDERVYAQTEDLLNNWRDNLRTFVPTDAHLKSVQAIVEHGFVLLLGEPMSGKTTIAAALALASADMWDCRPIFVNHPDDIKTHWNPEDPKQFFWVDDAFGQTQHSTLATEAWNRTFPLISAAIAKGAKFILTSRTHIYRAARFALKQSSFQLLGNSHVVINVEALTKLEKERILYNHLKLGNQGATFRKQIKPYLQQIADNNNFFPELAKRLGDAFFTKDLEITIKGLQRFIEEPLLFLIDIIKELDHPTYAGLAILFMRAGRISLPISVSPHESELLQLLGASLAELREALGHLDGTLISKIVDKNEHSWKFRHPTVRDAMSTLVAQEPDYIDIYLKGARIGDILSEVVCGGKTAHGAKVIVPATRYGLLVERIKALDLNGWEGSRELLPFLTLRCPEEFIVVWHRAVPAAYDLLLQQRRTWHSDLNVITSTLYKRGALSEERRKKVVASAIIDVSDSEFDCLGVRLRNLFTNDEYQLLVEKAKNAGLADLEYKIENLKDDYDDSDLDPTDFFEEINDKLNALEDVFIEDEKALTAIEDLKSLMSDQIEEVTDVQKKMLKTKELEEEREQDTDQRMREYYETVHGPDAAPPAQERPAVSAAPVDLPSPPRCIFDDIDQ